jgi:hypothetical protein
VTKKEKNHIADHNNGLISDAHKFHSVPSGYKSLRVSTSHDPLYRHEDATYEITMEGMFPSSVWEQ